MATFWLVDITLLYLTSYALGLNPIERIWGFREKNATYHLSLDSAR